MPTERLFPDADEVVRVGLRLPATHVAAIDTYAKSKGWTRSYCVAKLIQSLQMEGVNGAKIGLVPTHKRLP